MTELERTKGTLVLEDESGISLSLIPLVGREDLGSEGGDTSAQVQHGEEGEALHDREASLPGAGYTSASTRRR